MSTRAVANDFDQISPEYDATRLPLEPATLDGIVRALRDRGVQRVLEVGVGTGRIARPLEERGFEVTGLDGSLGMMAHARGKGVRRLVRGSAYRLPFRDQAFDATLFVHVLHTLDDPPSALSEADRVGREGAFALVHPGTGSDPAPRGGEREEGRRAFYRALAREGFPPPDRQGGPGVRERLILNIIPPNDVITLSDREVTEPLSQALGMFERRANRHTLNVPPATLERAVASARVELGDRAVTFRRIEALARWSRHSRTGRG
ncbi:MAG: class I SAM-dependent methyltransferase [Thermoplasmata archaeon]|nr:class I SAM-dependent methyltransferase [Thermoplasmata archaeon]